LYILLIKQKHTNNRRVLIYYIVRTTTYTSELIPSERYIQGIDDNDNKVHDPLLRYSPVGIALS